MKNSKGLGPRAKVFIAVCLGVSLSGFLEEAVDGFIDGYMGKSPRTEMTESSQAG